MDIIKVEQLNIPDIKVITFHRYKDSRGYFSEIYRNSQFGKIIPVKFVQINESFSKKGTLRGLHFQWQPPMGKLVRTIRGKMLDIVLDIRNGSPTLGKAIIYSLESSNGENYSQWLWIPPGFAHGNYFPQETRIEYLCSAEYRPKNEAAIYPLASDIDWSLSKITLTEIIKKQKITISEKDKHGLTLNKWLSYKNSQKFQYP